MSSQQGYNPYQFTQTNNQNQGRRVARNNQNIEHARPITISCDKKIGHKAMARSFVSPQQQGQTPQRQQVSRIPMIDLGQSNGLQKNHSFADITFRCQQTSRSVSQKSTTRITGRQNGGCGVIEFPKRNKNVQDKENFNYQNVSHIQQSIVQNQFKDYSFQNQNVFKAGRTQVQEMEPIMISSRAPEIPQKPQFQTQPFTPHRSPSPMRNPPQSPNFKFNSVQSPNSTSRALYQNQAKLTTFSPHYSSLDNTAKQPSFIPSQSKVNYTSVDSYHPQQISTPEPVRGQQTNQIQNLEGVQIKPLSIRSINQMNIDAMRKSYQMQYTPKSTKDVYKAAVMNKFEIDKMKKSPEQPAQVVQTPVQKTPEQDKESERSTSRRKKIKRSNFQVKKVCEKSRSRSRSKSQQIQNVDTNINSFKDTVKAPSEKSCPITPQRVDVILSVSEVKNEERATTLRTESKKSKKNQQEEPETPQALRNMIEAVNVQSGTLNHSQSEQKHNHQFSPGGLTPFDRNPSFGLPVHLKSKSKMEINKKSSIHFLKMKENIADRASLEPQANPLGDMEQTPSERLNKQSNPYLETLHEQKSRAQASKLNSPAQNSLKEKKSSKSVFGGLSYADEDNYCDLESLDNIEDLPEARETDQEYLDESKSESKVTEIEFNSFENFFPQKAHQTSGKQAGSIDFTMELSSNISNSIKQEKSKSKHSTIRKARVSKNEVLEAIKQDQENVFSQSLDPENDPNFINNVKHEHQSHNMDLSNKYSKLELPQELNQEMTNLALLTNSGIVEEYGIEALKNLENIESCGKLKTGLPMLKNIPYADNLNPFKEIYQEKYPDISLKEIKEASKQEERGSSIASKKEVFRLNSNPSGLSIHSPLSKNTPPVDTAKFATQEDTPHRDSNLSEVTQVYSGIDSEIRIATTNSICTHHSKRESEPVEIQMTPLTALENYNVKVTHTTSCQVDENENQRKMNSAPPATDAPKSNFMINHFDQGMNISGAQPRDYHHVIEQYSDGSVYKGYKLRSKKHGYGILILSNGSRYEGDWLNDVMSGIGKLFYDSGVLAYDGGFLNNKVDGHGIMFNEHQVDSSQIDENVKYFRDLTQIGDAWRSFEGTFSKDMKHGIGKWSLQNGDTFMGEFVDDKAEGRGTYTLNLAETENFEKIAGLWRGNKMIEIYN